MIWRYIGRLFGVFLLVASSLIFYGTCRDLSAGSYRTRNDVIYREKNPDKFLLHVGGLFALGVIFFAGGLYSVFRRKEKDQGE